MGKIPLGQCILQNKNKPLCTILLIHNVAKTVHVHSVSLYEYRHWFGQYLGLYFIKFYENSPKLVDYEIVGYAVNVFGLIYIVFKITLFCLFGGGLMARMGGGGTCL